MVRGSWLEPRGRATVDREAHDEQAGHQLLRGAGGSAAAGARAGAGRADRLRRHRHVGDGDLPPLQGVRGGAQRGDRPRQGAARRPRQLQDHPAPGRRPPAVRHAADEPAVQGTQGRLHPHRRRGRRRHTRKRRSSPGTTPAASPRPRTRSTPGCRVRRRSRSTPTPCTSTSPRNNTVEGTQWQALPRDRRHPAGVRHVVRLPVATVRHLAVRHDLRRRPEEPRAVGRHGGDHPRRPARPVPRQGAAELPALPHPRREELALQHAADVRHLHPAQRARLQQADRRAGGDREGEPPQGRAAVRLHRPPRRASTSRS